MTLSSAIRDNHSRGKVSDYLRNRITAGSKLSFVSAYFTIYAYYRLKDQLDSIDELNFLFGEPRFIQPEKLDPQKLDSKSFKVEDSEIKLANRLKQRKIAKECTDWIKEKVNIRSLVKPNFLHGKVYHILDGEVHNAIIGSSNFTVKGLGLDNAPNMELNLEVDSNRDREDLYNWFHELWGNKELVEDVKDQVLQYLEKLYRDNSPEFIYYVTLYNLFEKYLDEQTQADRLPSQTLLTETQVWNYLFQFQKDAVKGAINKIEKHNGCIIADSVGLGKTFEALAVIKYYELLNYRVLVLCPKKLKDNWTVYQAQAGSKLNKFPHDRLGYTVLCHTDLSRESGKSGDIDLSTFNWSAYDLVVIDESHNFRNNRSGKTDEYGNLIKKSRYQRLMEDIIQSGSKTKVLMLSATPVNNDLSDLRNQLYFITEDNDQAFQKSLNINSIKYTLSVAQRTFNEWSEAQKGDKRDSRVLLEKLSSGFFTLLDELTIARSRKHVQQYYHDELDTIGHFPKRLEPMNPAPGIAPEGRFMTYEQLNDEISKYKLSLFNPSFYVLEEFKEHYQEKSESKNIQAFTQESREHYLIGMMKINFLKRLESSIKSFEITLERTIHKINDLISRIEEFHLISEQNPDIDFDDLKIDDPDDDELSDAFQVGKKLKFEFAHMDTEDWLRDLKEDKNQLDKIYQQVLAIELTEDLKLQKLKELIKDKVTNPPLDQNGQPNKKVIVFSAFADTIDYLYDAIKPWVQDEFGLHIACVTGGTSGSKTTLGGNKFSEILMNFSPVSNQRRKVETMPQKEEIDILLATDCVSEGQNLQDCDYLINYDIHWNPVRIIQRFGRIDRIGSKNNVVQLVNFWPTKRLDKYINLKNRVEARMALVDITATGEEKIFGEKDFKELFENELTYRDKQLLKLQDEVLDLEDFNEQVTLSEFTLDDFRIDLMRFIEKNRELLEQTPDGLSTVVPSPSGEYADLANFGEMSSDIKKIIAPGVIFCLRHKEDGDELKEVNPLQPHFLIYIRDDNTVRYSFTHPKQILEIYRLLCSGKENPYEKLCQLFDQETNDGDDLSRYTKLLDSAVKSIRDSFKTRTINSITAGRDAILPEVSKQIQDSSDFELVTWLVIK